MGWGAHEPPDEGTHVRPGSGSFLGSLEESRTVLDSGCAALENKSGFFFISFSNLAFHGIFCSRVGEICL